MSADRTFVTSLDQYLRLRVDGASMLLPGRASVAIENRDALTLNTGGGRVVAWRVQGGKRLPAYCLDRGLKPVRRDDWERVVFLDDVGIAVDEVEMLGRVEGALQPFTPLGAAPTPAGHLYNGAWVNGQRAMLVLDPRALIAYLQTLGE
jgi:hypothetical protein